MRASAAAATAAPYGTAHNAAAIAYQAFDAIVAETDATLNPNAACAQTDTAATTIAVPTAAHADIGPNADAIADSWSSHIYR